MVTPVHRRDDHSEDDFINIRFEYLDGSLNWKSPMALKKKGIVRNENEIYRTGEM